MKGHFFQAVGPSADYELTLPADHAEQLFGFDEAEWVFDEKKSNCQDIFNFKGATKDSDLYIFSFRSRDEEFSPPCTL